jgi:hypothetical protein
MKQVVREEPEAIIHTDVEKWDHVATNGKLQYILVQVHNNLSVRVDIFDPTKSKPLTSNNLIGAIKCALDLNWNVYKIPKANQDMMTRFVRLDGCFPLTKVTRTTPTCVIVDRIEPYYHIYAAVTNEKEKEVLVLTCIKEGEYMWVVITRPQTKVSVGPHKSPQDAIKSALYNNFEVFQFHCDDIKTLKKFIKDNL